MWLGKTNKSPREEFLYYTSQGELEGIRQGQWKLLVKKPAAPRPQQNGKSKPPNTAIEPELLLFNLQHDLGEQTNQAAMQEEIVNRLRARMEELDAEITQNARAPWMKP